MPTPPSEALTRYRLFWQHKPWWCQPWSILLTGSIGSGATLLAQRLIPLPWWVVIPVLMGILGWWLLFLVLVPFSVSEP